MGFRYAVFFACIAAACAFWQTRMTVRNPENNPLLNDVSLGPLQNATEVIDKQTGETHVLVFRSKNHEPGIKCVEVIAENFDSEKKSAEYKRKFKNGSTTVNTTIKVKALKQKGYSVENVIRAAFKGEVPSEPVPEGSNTYIQYGDYECNSSASPFVEAAKAALAEGGAAVSASEGGAGAASIQTRQNEDTQEKKEQKEKQKEDETEQDKKEGSDYLDIYVVYEQENCSILRTPLLKGECDFWMQKTVLENILNEATKLPANEESTTSDAAAENEGETTGEVKERDDEDNGNTAKKEISGEAHHIDKELFKKLPKACRFAFLTACGPPKFQMYDKDTCTDLQNSDTQTTLT